MTKNNKIDKRKYEDETVNLKTFKNSVNNYTKNESFSFWGQYFDKTESFLSCKNANQEKVKYETSYTRLQSEINYPLHWQWLIKQGYQHYILRPFFIILVLSFLIF